MRHITAFNDGEDLDPESGQSHLYHAMCCLAFVGTYQATKTGTDDRHQVPEMDDAKWQAMIDAKSITPDMMKLHRANYDRLMNIKAVLGFNTFEEYTKQLKTIED